MRDTVSGVGLPARLSSFMAQAAFSVAVLAGCGQSDDAGADGATARTYYAKVVACSDAGGNVSTVTSSRCAELDKAEDCDRVREECLGLGLPEDTCTEVYDWCVAEDDADDSELPDDPDFPGAEDWEEMCAEAEAECLEMGFEPEECDELRDWCLDGGWDDVLPPWDDCPGLPGGGAECFEAFEDCMEAGEELETCEGEVAQCLDDLLGDDWDDGDWDDGDWDDGDWDDGDWDDGAMECLDVFAGCLESTQDALACSDDLVACLSASGG